MSSAAEHLPPEVQTLIDQKKFDALEALWTKKMEEDAEDLTFFFGVAAAVKKKGEGRPRSPGCAFSRSSTPRATAKRESASSFKSLACRRRTRACERT